MSSLSPVQIENLPRSVEDFVALRDTVAQTPQGGAAVMILALLAYSEDEDLGLKCLTIAVDSARLEEGHRGYKGKQLRNADLRRIQQQVRGKPFLLRSYLRGTTPECGYELPPSPYVLEFSDNPYSGDAEAGPYKVFVASSGASSPRPTTVKRNNRGLWKASEWSSLIVGVKPPEQEIDDDL